ncbi:SRPBCC family protein [Peterkaempfera griseoplana]|uniref:SRPBCC family protein n=1 Tax=Peterkaempfera griseoplana TaxID=66896 RepID=UPI0006E31DEC|nr:SRPBCC family protein [Peterkaempfera griseoplana]
MDDHGVTGARVDLEVLVDAPRAALWERITDVTRIGEWSPECVHAAWLDAGDPRARPGARFEARNRYPDGQVLGVVCQVTTVEPPRTFAWSVLDDDRDPARPGSLWRYDLLPGDTPGRTLVRQSFVHGPGRTGLSVAAGSDPARTASVLAGRLEQLRRNMARTVEAMVRDIRESRTTGSGTAE